MFTIIVALLTYNLYTANKLIDYSTSTDGYYDVKAEVEYLNK